MMKTTSKLSLLFLHWMGTNCWNDSLRMHLLPPYPYGFTLSLHILPLCIQKKKNPLGLVKVLLLLQGSFLIVYTDAAYEGDFFLQAT